MARIPKAPHLVETYRRKAKRYDLTSRLYPFPGYPQHAHRRRAVQALGLRPGASVIDIGCGTGLNFPLIEEAIGRAGRIVGVDLTDAMLARARDRIETNGWSNISLVQADAAEFEFPTGVDAILATYPHALLPESGQAIARGAAALEEWIERRPWEEIRAAMQDTLADVSFTELSFGIAYLAAGSRGAAHGA